VRDGADGSRQRHAFHRKVRSREAHTTRQAGLQKAVDLGLEEQGRVDLDQHRVRGLEQRQHRLSDGGAW